MGGQSSLTLTLYFSGRFTLVGARHETEVYRVCARVSRTLWQFRQRGPGVEEGVAYDQWVERVEEEERRRGRLGWEDEAERVRQLMGARERRMAAQEERRQDARQGEVRVKAEPGRKEEEGEVGEEKREGREEREATAVEAGTTAAATGKAMEDGEAKEEEKGTQGEVGDAAAVVMTDAQQPSAVSEGADDVSEDVEWE